MSHAQPPPAEDATTLSKWRAKFTDSHSPSGYIVTFKALTENDFSTLKSVLQDIILTSIDTPGNPRLLIREDSPHYNDKRGASKYVRQWCSHLGIETTNVVYTSRSDDALAVSSMNSGSGWDRKVQADSVSYGREGLPSWFATDSPWSYGDAEVISAALYIVLAAVFGGAGFYTQTSWFSTGTYSYGICRTIAILIIFLTLTSQFLAIVQTPAQSSGNRDLRFKSLARTVLFCDTLYVSSMVLSRTGQGISLRRLAGAAVIVLAFIGLWWFATKLTGSPIPKQLGLGLKAVLTAGPIALIYRALEEIFLASMRLNHLGIDVDGIQLAIACWGSIIYFACAFTFAAVLVFRTSPVVGRGVVVSSMMGLLSLLLLAAATLTVCLQVANLGSGLANNPGKSSRNMSKSVCYKSNSNSSWIGPVHLIGELSGDRVAVAPFGPELGLANPHFSVVKTDDIAAVEPSGNGTICP